MLAGKGNAHDLCRLSCLHRLVSQNKEGNEELMRDLHPGGEHY